MMHKDLGLFDTGAGFNHVSRLLIRREWEHCIECEKMLNLQSVTKQLLHMDGKTPLPVRFSALCAHIWISIGLT